MKLLHLLPLLLLSLPLAAREAIDSSEFGQVKRKIEVGAAGFISNGPDYPGSEQNHTNGLAVPYLIYRGDRFRLGDDGAVRAMALDTGRFELDLSLAGAFNANSSDNEAREGMPDLDYLFEIGPQLKWHFAFFQYDDDSQGRLTWANHVRAVFSTDFRRLDHQGYKYESDLRFERRDLMGVPWDVFFDVSASWATQEAHAYIYQVDPEFATDTRPAYQASAGYLGTRISLSTSYKHKERLRVFLSGGVGLLHGAANQNSPLLREDVNYSVALGLAYSFYLSDETVIR